MFKGQEMITYANNPDELIKIGEEMRKAADKYPVEFDPKGNYSKTEEEARSKPENKELGEEMAKVGLCKCIVLVFKDRQIPLSVAISLDVFEKSPLYHVSFGILAGEGKFIRTPDGLANIIAVCLLGQDVKEIEREGPFHNIRHFVRAAITDASQN